MYDGELIVTEVLGGEARFFFFFPHEGRSLRGVEVKSILGLKHFHYLCLRMEVVVWTVQTKQHSKPSRFCPLIQQRSVGASHEERFIQFDIPG